MRHLTCFLLLLSSLLVSSCDDTLEDPALVNPDEILKVDVSSVKSLKVSSLDSVQITARIPKNAGALDVSFKTTLGIFPKTASKEIKEYADSIKGNYRMAYVTLKPGAEAGTAYITVDVTAQRRRVQIVLLN